MYWTKEEEYIPNEFLTSISGKSEVKHRDVIDGTPFRWSQNNKNRFFYDCTYDLQNHKIRHIRVDVKDEKDTKDLLEVDCKIVDTGQDVTDSCDNKSNKKKVTVE